MLELMHHPKDNVINEGQAPRFSLEELEMINNVSWDYSDFWCIPQVTNQQGTGAHRGFYWWEQSRFCGTGRGRCGNKDIGIMLAYNKNVLSKLSNTRYVERK